MRRSFDLLIETATTQTRKIGEYTIPGLGKLVKPQRAARIGRNPATVETIKIKAKTTVKWRSDRLEDFTTRHEMRRSAI